MNDLPLASLITASVAGEITDYALADVTGDGCPEWILLVWRPWRDWPIQRWLEVPSPIAGFRDQQGWSCHLILIDPNSGRELWAGSALPAPIIALDAGDVDGDAQAEVVALEGDYITGRSGPASHIVLWHWAGFGFKLKDRSAPGVFHQLYLTPASDRSILQIVVR